MGNVCTVAGCARNCVEECKRINEAAEDKHDHSYFFFFLSFGATDPSSLGPPHSLGLEITNNNGPH